MTATDVLRSHVPGACLDGETGQVGINGGYDPDFDAGLLEKRIWNLVESEVVQMVQQRAMA